MSASAIFFALVLICAFNSNLAQDEVPISAKCIMDGTHGKGNVTGTLSVSQSGMKRPIWISGTLKGKTIQSGLHGFHIHEKGELGNSCQDAGGHLNPTRQEHGAPDAAVRHVGDLGNVRASRNAIQVDIEDEVASLYGDNSILGKALVLHAGQDDLGNGGNDGSVATGNAGGRLQCCVIVEIGEKNGAPAVPVSSLLLALTALVALKRLLE